MPDQLIPFMLVAVAIIVSPGPDTALGLRNSVRGGATAMWWTGVGCCAGLVVHAAASVIGLSALLMASATAYTVVKFVGAAYLMWLGASTLWHTWRHRHDPEPVEPEEPVGSAPITRRAAFRQGVVSNLFNPKIVLLFLTLLPQFVSAGEPRTATLLSLTATFIAASVLWWRLLSWLVAGARDLLRRRRVRVLLERVTGTVMVALGLRVALDS